MEDEPNGIPRIVPGEVIGAGSQSLPRPGRGQPEVMEVVIDALEGRGMVRIKYQLKEYRHRKNSTWAWTAFYAEAVDG